MNSENSPNTLPEISVQSMAPSTEVPPVLKQFLQPLKEISTEKNKIFITDGRSKVEITVYAEDILRIRLAPLGEFLDDFSYAVIAQPLETKFFTFDDEEFFIIETEKISCRVRKADLCISFFNKNNLLINEDLRSLHFEEDREYGGYRVFCTKKLQADEHFFGLGDKAVDFDLLHQHVQLWGTDSYAFERNYDPLYKNIPFYIGIHGKCSYGVFFDNTYRTHFDFGRDDWNAVNFSADGGEMNYYFMYDEQPTEVIRKYHALTGTHPMFPRWALGFHQSRWTYFPEKKLLEVAETFRGKKIPCDALYLDIDYMDGFRCFTWNKNYFPDPAKMLTDLKAAGFKTVVIIDPGIKVDDDYKIYEEAKAKNLFCRRSDDYNMEGYVWPGRCMFPDFTDARVRHWWGFLFQELLEQGVSGIWNDMNEPAVFGRGTFPYDVRHDYDDHRCSHRKAHNIYGMQMLRATYDGLKSLQPETRPFTISRSGYAGMQRYGCTWTGDNQSTWDHLKLALQMMLRLSVSGVSFCGSDIGGFIGEADEELYIRWMQLGVFSPFMRVHSAYNTSDREPWMLGHRAERISRKFIELRYKLIHYFYSVLWENHQYGFPMLRPMFLVEQNEQNFSVTDQFLFGDKMLVAPVMDAGTTRRNVYLPEGSWYHFWDFSLLPGNQWHEVKASLDAMPIFVKAGSVLPEHSVMQFVGEKQERELVLNVYFAPHVTHSLLYEDDGGTFDYEQEIYEEKRFETFGDGQHLVIQQSVKGSYMPKYENYKLKVYGLPFHANRILVDRKEIRNFKTIRHNKIAVFRAPKNFQGIEIFAE